VAQKGSEESIRGQVRSIASKFIKSKSGEVSYSEIMSHLYEQLPSANKNTLLGAINAFRADHVMISDNAIADCAFSAMILEG